MRKIVSIVFCMLLLCGLFLTVGTTLAAEPGYSYSEYYGGAAVTVDGKWTDPDEWHDVPVAYIPATGPHFGLWEYKMDTTDYMMTWLLEFADSTNDPGDRFEICIDGGNDGGSAPNANDVKIVIEGHATMKTYVGSGTGWTETPWTATFANTLTTSPHDPATHWVCEIKFSKSQWDWGANPPPHGVRVAMYDASQPGLIGFGWIAWPPEPISKDNPSRWGVIPDYMAAPAPEVLTLGVMLTLSTIAVITSVRYFRKPPKL